MLQIKPKTFISLLALGVLLPIIRFNSNTYIIKQQSYDQKYFAAYVQYFRGEAPTEPIKPATNWRLLLPLLASFLPFEPKTALNIINYAAFLFATLAIRLVCLKVSNNKLHAQYAMLLYVFSFPSVYYSCIGYADTLCLFFMAWGVYAVIHVKNLLYWITFILGFLTKETMVLIIPFATVYYWFIKKNAKAVTVAIISLAISVLIRWLLVKFAPVTNGYSNQIFWQINLQSVLLNLNRFNTWFAALATILPLLLGYFFSIKKMPKALHYAILATILSALILWLYSFVTTVADGRIWWMTYPALLISCCYLFKTEKQNNQH